MSDTYFGTWLDLSDPEQGREDDWLDAWSALDEEQEPPDPDSCPACDGQGCLVCCSVPARPEGGERDAD